jgi:ubiquinone biosynthesis protein Coq4
VGRKKVVKLHDLHHLATGYGTDLIGEAEIGAWELRAGCVGLAAYVYNGMAVAMGLLLAPIRTLQAFRDARGTTTLYRLGLDYDAALTLELTELRARLGVKPEGTATRHPVRLHGKAPQRRHAAA